MNFSIHRAIMRYRGEDLIHPSDKTILLALADCAGMNDITAWPGVAYLCLVTLYKDRQVRVSLKRLEQNGFIKAENGRKERIKLYTFNMEKLAVRESDNKLTPRNHTPSMPRPVPITEELQPPSEPDPPSMALEVVDPPAAGGTALAETTVAEGDILIERRGSSSKGGLRSREAPSFEQVLARNAHDINDFLADLMGCGLPVDFVEAKREWTRRYGKPSH